jgi:hypothetical protein
MLARATFASVLGILAVSLPARAADPSPIDMQEHVFGQSNVNAVAGHGRLTAGISDDGDVTVLSWPGPSYADQIAYLAQNALDVRDLPHAGAPDGMGSYLGLVATTASGDQLVWLRDPSSFTHAQRYTTNDAPVPETTFTSAALGLTVVVTDIVSPGIDLLTRRVSVKRANGSPVTSLQLVVYENLSPTLSRIPELPIADWALDGRNDFVALYDANEKFVVHFTPGDRGQITQLLDVKSDPTTVDYGPIDALMQTTPTDADVDGLLASLDQKFPKGVAGIVTTEPRPSAFQVGSDATAICPMVTQLIQNIVKLPKIFPGLTLPVDPSELSILECKDPLPALRMTKHWTYAPTDALANLAAGPLDGSRIAAGATNAVLLAPLTFTGDAAEGSALFAFGATLAGAKKTLADGTATNAAARQAASEKAGHDALAGAKLPSASLGGRVVDVARRSLVNLYVARDASSGAFVASISRQPPYYIDWPRDGSFIQQSLDVAGIFPWVTERSEWYTTIIRTTIAPPDPFLAPETPTNPATGVKGFPAWAWEMNYYADGTVGGNLHFEIDNTALHVWSVVAHAAALEGAERNAFIAKVWPTTKKALELLRTWKDEKTGLPAPASEDDHAAFTSTLHGATAVYVAMVAGAQLANVVPDADEADLLGARVAELRDAIEKTYFDPKTGLFHDTVPPGTDIIPGTTGLGSTAWLVWPARFLDPSDSRLEHQLASDLVPIMKDIRGETGGGAYVMKNVVAAALLGKDGGSRDTAKEAVTRLADIATPDTLHFGEVFVTTHPNGMSKPPVFSARVAPPHVWEGMLFYLSAMALTSPDRFDLQVAAFPPPPVPMPTPVMPESSTGCGCRFASPDGAGSALALAALALAFTARRGRRTPRS